MKLLLLSIAFLAQSAIKSKVVSAFTTAAPRRHVTNIIGQQSSTIHQMKVRNNANQFSSLQKLKHQYHYIFGAVATITNTNNKLYASTGDENNGEDISDNNTSQVTSEGTASTFTGDESSEEEQEEVIENLNEQYDYTNHIPKTGYSLSDTLENSSPENKERFVTTLTPIITGINSANNDNMKEEKVVLEFQYDQDGFPIGYNAQETKYDKEEKNKNKDEGEEDGTTSKRHQGVARIDTISTLGNAGEEPVRWLVSLDHDDTYNDEGSSNEEEVNKRKESYAMIDLPPYSDKLANEIRFFMDPTYNTTTTSTEKDSSGGTIINNASKGGSASLDMILLTNQQCIHYDNSPGVYVTRKSDLNKWKKAFPLAEVIMYRLDIPRECRDQVTQVLDGYGPWGWDEKEEENDDEEVDEGGEEQGGDTSKKKKFVENGRPLTIEEWPELPPDDQLDDDEEDGNSSSSDDGDDADDNALYTPEAIRQRENNHRLLAVYTPGSTFGSVTYIFPKRGICCSGHALPIESSGNTATIEYDDNGEDDDDPDFATRSSSSPIPPQGPRLDYQGYLASSASRPRQMSSASSLINSYIDRFRVILPARGDVVFLDSDVDKRKRELMEMVGLYQKISDIYSRLGIVEK